MMAAFLSLLVSNIFFAGCLAIFAFSVTKVWRSPNLAHALWLLVLVKLVTPPIVQLPMYQFILASNEESTGDGHSGVLVPPSIFRNSPSLDETTPTIATLSPRPRTRPDHANDGRSVVSSWQTLVLNCLYWLLAGWVVGTLVYLSVAIRRHLRLFQLIADSQAPDLFLHQDAQQLAQQMGLTACPPLRVTRAHVCPLVAPSWKKLVVLLPQHLLSELNRDQVRTVLAHELAHIRRRDHWIRTWEVFVLALHWWNPVAWWASRQLRQAEEECCDAWVVWALPDGRRTYGRTLLQTVEYLTSDKILPVAAETTFHSCQLERRINMILNRMMNRKISRSAFALTLVAGSIVLPLGVTQVFSADPPAAVAADEGNGRGLLSKDILNDPLHKSTILNSIGTNVAKLVDFTKSGQANYRTVAKSWRGGVEQVTSVNGRIYFEGNNFRISANGHHRSNADGTTREIIDIDEQILTEKWFATMSDDIIRVWDPPGEFRPDLCDPRAMAKPFVANLDKLTATKMMYEGRPCYQLEEVYPFSAVRSVQIVDPERNFALVREEAYYDNSTRRPEDRLRVDNPFRITTFDHQKQEGVGIWMPVKSIQRSFDSVPLTENREATMTSEVITEFSNYLFKSPGRRRFTLYDLRLSGATRLRDNRKSLEVGKWYRLPPPRNLVAASSVPQTPELPSDLAAQWMEDSTTP